MNDSVQTNLKLHPGRARLVGIWQVGHDVVPTLSFFLLGESPVQRLGTQPTI
jgi:hypothetical protein